MARKALTLGGVLFQWRVGACCVIGALAPRIKGRSNGEGWNKVWAPGVLKSTMLTKDLTVDRDIYT
jgi:hypothetical protein